MKRRHFFKKFSLWLTASAGAITGISFLRQFYPPSFVRKQKVKIGNANEFPLDTFSYIEKYEIYIYRDHEGVSAVSAVCTHLGCILNKSIDGFECPCHGSTYNKKGEVLSGPAPTSLNWFNLYVAQDGKLIVDLDSRVDPGFKYNIT
ncbi:MAG: ubiquinol-cytochrome c reductase iron-sulfur subunit [bacterium]